MVFSQEKYSFKPYSTLSGISTRKWQEQNVSEILSNQSSFGEVDAVSKYEVMCSLQDSQGATQHKRTTAWERNQFEAILVVQAKKSAGILAVVPSRKQGNLKHENYEYM